MLQSNSLQVVLKASVDSGLIVMPAGMRGYEGERADETLDDDNIGTCAMLALPELQLFLRTHDYFMGTSLNHLSLLDAERSFRRDVTQC